jgi:plasmid stabilization system protein ParE
MSRFIVTRDARADLLTIANYIADFSIEAAHRVTDEIESSFAQLANMPGMGHFREEVLDRHFRFWRVHSYLICYRWDVTPIQIIAVVHGARDLDAFFEDRGPSMGQ